MKQIESVVVAIDGESKCGKTTVINAIADEALFQARLIPNLLENGGEWGFVDDTLLELETLQQRWGFDNITKISAGNSYRAAALYMALCEIKGIEKSEFVAEDISAVREILA